MDISKKALLELTKISYGQLYRWKREGLIPESWFVKRASPTGQETYFPREKILERIYTIQKLKDKYSLEELAKLLSPDASKETYVEEAQISRLKAVNPYVLDVYKLIVNNVTLKRYDVLLVLVFSKIQRELALSDEAITKLMYANVAHAQKVGCIDQLFIVLLVQDTHYMVMMQENNDLEKKAHGLSEQFDARIKVLCVISGSDVHDEFRKANAHLF